MKSIDFITQLNASIQQEQEDSRRLFLERYNTPLQDTEVYRYHAPKIMKLVDEWSNPPLNLNTNYSFTTQTKFWSYRLSYQELEYLGEEPFIQNIIDIKSQDIIGNWGSFVIKEGADNAGEIILQLESKLNKLKFLDVVREATITTLIYGGALIYTKLNGINSNEIINLDYDIYNGKDITLLRVFSPRDAIGIPGNTTNATEPYYMLPQAWLVNNIKFNATQITPLLFHDVSRTRKFYYNFLGISLIQKAIPFVRKFETVYNLIIEYLARARTLHVSSNSTYSDSNEFYKALMKAKHFLTNNGIIGTNTDETVNILHSPINGFHELANFSAQLIASICRIPATKLLGYSPLGLNNTGEYDLKTYYDVIEGYQKTYLKPVIIEIAQKVLWSLGYNYEIDFIFTPLAQESNIEKTQRFKEYTGVVDTLTNAGIIDNELAFNMLKEQEVIPPHAEFPYEDDVGEEINGN